jgi:hypothetical protein
MEFARETNPISACSADAVAIGVFDSEGVADVLAQLDSELPEEILAQAREAAELGWIQRQSA